MIRHRQRANSKHIRTYMYIYTIDVLPGVLLSCAMDLDFLPSEHRRSFQMVSQARACILKGPGDANQCNTSTAFYIMVSVGDGPSHGCNRMETNTRNDRQSKADGDQPDLCQTIVNRRIVRQCISSLFLF